MAVVFALGAGLSFGTADFVGGLAAKRSPATTVTVLSQVGGQLLGVLHDRPSSGTSHHTHVVTSLNSR
ncbi:MAG TPA: hypothetical protein VID94_03315 [Acidimicrobiales bacterium]